MIHYAGSGGFIGFFCPKNFLKIEDNLLRNS